MWSRSRSLVTAIRRDILSLLAETEGLTVPAATAVVAARWSSRLRRRGQSPSSALTAAALVFQVGADLEDEVAGDHPADRPGRDATDGTAGSVADRVTWERCPRCGGPAAVGWSSDEIAVEFDCPAGCVPGPEEVGPAVRCPTGDTPR